MIQLLIDVSYVRYVRKKVADFCSNFCMILPIPEFTHGNFKKIMNNISAKCLKILSKSNQNLKLNLTKLWKLLENFLKIQENVGYILYGIFNHSEET